MLSEKFSNFIRRANKEEPLALRRPRMLGGSLMGLVAGLTFGLTMGTIDAVLFSDLPIAILWGPSILTGIILGVVLALVGALTGWYSDRVLGVGAGAIAIAIVGLGVQLLVVGVGAVGIIMLVVLVFPISVISLPIAMALRWLGDHYMRIHYQMQPSWKRAGLMLLLFIGAFLLGVFSGSFQRMGAREERSARLIDTALRLAPSDPEQAKRLPLATLPGLKEHLGTPYTLRVTPSKISSVGYDIHVVFDDGFAITCVTVASHPPPTCAPVTPAQILCCQNRKLHGLLKKIIGALTGPGQKEYYVFQVKCKRCGEIIEGRVDVDNDLSVEYEGGGDNYYCRKVLMGDGKNLCYQQIEVGLKFSARRNLLERRIESGGDFVED